MRHALEQTGVELLTFKDQVIFERDEVLTQAGGMFSVFTPYKRAWMQKLNAFYLKAIRCGNTWRNWRRCRRKSYQR